MLLLTASGLSAQGTSPVLADIVRDAQSLDQPNNAARLEAVQALVRARGLTFTPQPVPNTAQFDSRQQGQNLVIDLGGPAGAPEIILGAHVDAARLPDGSTSHGMVDNAAGVAVVVRVAATLRTQKLRHRVRVVLFDLEESGLLGSQHFVTTLDKLDRERVRAMVNVDIGGYGDTIIAGRSGQPGTAPLFASFGRICAEQTYACVSFSSFPPSDDRSFQAAGVPSISLAVLPGIEAHQMWLLMHGGKEPGLSVTPAIVRTIHTPNDTTDKLNASSMTLLHDAVVALISELDAL